jgi:general secretion pathway protein A
MPAPVAGVGMVDCTGLAVNDGYNGSRRPTESGLQVYLDFYHLKREPFCLAPDPKFLHLAEPHRNALVSLVQGVMRHRGFLIATGAVGTGKTTILNAVLYMLSNLHKSGERKLVSAFLVNPLLTAQEFLESVLDEFEVQVPSPTKPRRLLALHELFLDAQKGGGTAVLIIDEAHLLTVELLEEIRLLTNMDTHREKLLQVILCGQPELASVLLQPQLRALRQRIALLAQLRPLTAAETAAYIEQRLRLAGLEGPAPFSPPALEEVYRRTQGVPRLINILCDSCLTISVEMHCQDVDLQVVRTAASALTLTPPAAAVSTNVVGPSHGNGDFSSNDKTKVEPARPLSPQLVVGDTPKERATAGGNL